ncbi:MAG: hypothetical protein ABSA83_15960 [Verrucomicrobiota bacterium]|jgi:hypothetical protein
MDKRFVIVRVLTDCFYCGNPRLTVREEFGAFFLGIRTNFARLAGSLALVLVFVSSALTACANVYATDIKLNGSLDAAVIVPGDVLTVSYILNDTASGGVWVRIYSGTNLVQTLSSAEEEAGTNSGLNTAIWSNTPDMAQGVYTVSITAASTGYSTWTNITDDGPNFFVNFPSGIAVNQNTNSLYYGRVYVANSYPTGGDSPGDQVGILKCNADGSPADEGGFSTGGYGWGGQSDSPWKMAIGADDRVYVDDYANQGVVVSFNPILDDNSQRQVVRTDNYPQPTVYFTGLSVIGSGANAAIWMTDAELSGSVGVNGWQIGTNGVAADNDPGFVVVPLDSSFLTKSPFDIAVDTNGYIDVIQMLTTEDPAYAVMSFKTYGGMPVTMANWADGMFPQLLEAYGIASDPAGSRLAVAVVGTNGFEYDTTGGIYLYCSTNGDFMTDIDQTGGDGYYDVAWDNVGNLYALDNTRQVWRIYSPPGTNQATTVAVPVAQAYSALQPPTLINPVAEPAGLRFTLQGQSNVTYIIQSSSDLTQTNWSALKTNFSCLENRAICVPVGGDQEYYRAVTGQ